MGITDDVLNTEVKDNYYMVCIWPAAEVTQTKAAEALLKQAGRIVYAQDVELTYLGMKNFMTQIYGHQAWTGTIRNQFRGTMGKADACYKAGKAPPHCPRLQRPSCTWRKVCNRRQDPLRRVKEYIQEAPTNARPALRQSACRYLNFRMHSSFLFLFAFFVSFHFFALHGNKYHGSCRKNSGYGGCHPCRRTDILAVCGGVAL